MDIIVDSGSTKGDWKMINGSEIILQTRTLGLNPAVLSDVEIERRIVENRELKSVFSEVRNLYFYGAGCGTSSPKTRLKNILTSLFPNAEIFVYEDTLAAVRAVTREEGIVCILGTGSNSCYFDGEKIEQPIPSLGYTIMDEAGGFYFGRELLRDYFYKRMPEEFSKEFEKRFNPDANDIKNNLYQKPQPNAYVASFSQFIFEKPEMLIPNSYFYKLLRKGIQTFIDCRILTFEKARELPIHFVGSIAFFSKEIIYECFAENNLILGNVIQHPIEGLILYHQTIS